MGAWGEKAFENDSALDWLSELGGVDDLRDTLARVAEAAESEYVDVDDGTAAIAAAEIVAADVVSDASRLNRDATLWLVANAKALSAEDVALARRAVSRVMAKNSELSSLWGEGAWKADMRVLSERLA